MAKSDPDEEIEKIQNYMKQDLQTLDSAIVDLLKEATGSKSSSAMHNVASPLTKLISSKQKTYDQLLKVLSDKKESINEKYEEEVEFDLESEYSKFEEEAE